MEKGSDERLYETGATKDQILAMVEREQERLATEEERLASMGEQEEDPGKTYPSPDYSDADDPRAKEPAPNYDPLPEE